MSFGLWLVSCGLWVVICDEKSSGNLGRGMVE